MSLLFVDGFDAQDSSVKWDGGQNGYPRATTPYGTGRSIEVGSLGSMNKKIPPSAAVYVGMAMYNQSDTYSTNSNSGLLFLRSDNNTTTHVFLRPDTSLSMGLYCGATLLGSFPIAGLKWQYFEFYAKISDTLGEYTAKINGTVVLSATNVDTKNGGTSTDIDCIGIGNCYGANGVILDDLYISDSEFLGEIRVQTLVPTAAGSSTQLTPSSGANYTNVADIPDVTTSRNYSATVGHKDLYTLGDLASSTATIKAVQVNNHARKTDVGSIGMRNVVKSGATLANGTTKSLSATTGWTGDLWETDPNTSAAWATTAVNSLEAGAEVA